MCNGDFDRTNISDSREILHTRTHANAENAVFVRVVAILFDSRDVGTNDRAVCARRTCSDSTRLDQTGRLVVVGSFCFSRVPTYAYANGYILLYVLQNKRTLHTSCMFTRQSDISQSNTHYAAARHYYPPYNTGDTRRTDGDTRVNIHMYDSDRAYCVSAVRRRLRRRQWAPPRVKRINLARRLRPRSNKYKLCPRDDRRIRATSSCAPPPPPHLVADSRVLVLINHYAGVCEFFVFGNSLRRDAGRRCPPLDLRIFVVSSLPSQQKWPNSFGGFFLFLFPTVDPLYRLKFVALHAIISNKIKLPSQVNSSDGFGKGPRCSDDSETIGR